MATNHGGRPPRAVIHKRILESAETRPDASMAELAADLPGASPDLVERVLEEYGDPAADAAGTAEAGPAAADGTEDEPMTDAEPTTPELSDDQREALRAIAEHPEATQAELADVLGVSGATVNKRVNAIEGFSWDDRVAFVERVLGGAPAEATDGSTDDAPADALDGAGPTDVPAAGGLPRSPDADGDARPAASDGGQLVDPTDAEALEGLKERVDRLEAERGAAGEAAIDDPALLAKVVRAVVADDAITDEEELRVLEALL
ncbi:MAG: winged helix-turn-helix domain-containing protein [Halobacteriales archaeon]